MLFCLQYRCLGSVVMNDGTPFAAWISRDGETMKYWGGASSRRNFIALAEKQVKALWLNFSDHSNSCAKYAKYLCE